MTSPTPPPPPAPPPPPPPPPSDGGAASPGPQGSGSDVGLEPNIAGLLCYAPCCIGLVMSVVAAVVEKRSKFIRFHAFQSLLLHAAGVVLWLASLVLGFVASAIAAPLGFVVSLLFMVAGIAFLALMIFLMVRAYNREEYSLPYVGPLARQWT